MYSQYRQLLLTSSLIIATVNATTQAACNDIKQALPGKLWLPGQAPYIQENKDYYNSGLVELGPACIALPTSAADVSSIVQILNRHSTVNFAIKSGGHSPNAGDSSIKDGVLIALRHINGTTYDAAKQVAHVKPGGHWSDVVSALSSTGRMVVGGRLGVVGIGGYLMQGGVSFFSAQYGLGGDNVIEYETVLANGSIVNINQDRHKDLVVAMRGGGSQFGIVTKFTLKTYPVKEVWVGVRIYQGTREEFYDALQDFVSNQWHYPKMSTLFPISTDSPMVGDAGYTGLLGSLFSKSATTQTKQIISALGYYNHLNMSVLMPREQLESVQRLIRSTENSAVTATTSPTRYFAMPIFYDGEKPPEAAFGKKFNNLTRIATTGTLINYKTMMLSTDSLFQQLALRMSFRTMTIPVQPGNPSLLLEFEDRWNNITKTHIKQAKGLVNFAVNFQPFSRAFGRAAEERGGNAMGLSANDHDRIVVEFAGIHTHKADDELVLKIGKKFTEEFGSYMKSVIKATGQSVKAYNPYFMNDAGVGQDVIGTYRDANKFALLQKEMDPQGLFSRRAGGYKFRKCECETIALTST